MTRQDQNELNRETIKVVYQLIKVKPFCPPSYKAVCFFLWLYGFNTSRGNKWTPKRLFRMLQRMGYSGLHGVFHSYKHKDD